MKKSTVLYSMFKNMFLAGEGYSAITQVLNKSLAGQRQYDEGNKTKDQEGKRAKVLKRSK